MPDTMNKVVPKIGQITAGELIIFPHLNGCCKRCGGARSNILCVCATASRSERVIAISRKRSGLGGGVAADIVDYTLDIIIGLLLINLANHAHHVTFHLQCCSRVYNLPTQGGVQ